MTTGDSGPAGRAAPAGMPACHRDRRGREELRASGQEREHVPIPGGNNAGTGWTPDNGLVSRGVDAVAVCPISGGYRTFAEGRLDAGATIPLRTGQKKLMLGGRRNYAPLTDRRPSRAGCGERKRAEAERD